MPPRRGKSRRAGRVAVLVDPEAACVKTLRPDALVDAILAKKNMGTRITDAPVVVAVGPGFTAGVDCHAAVETMRGHTLGRVLYEGSPLPNTGVPGVIAGYAAERVLRARRTAFSSRKRKSAHRSKRARSRRSSAANPCSAR